MKHEIGEGRHPPPVTEMGPDEVKAVAVAFNQMRDNLTRLDQERATFLAGAGFTTAGLIGTAAFMRQRAERSK